MKDLTRARWINRYRRVRNRICPWVINRRIKEWKREHPHD